METGASTRLNSSLHNTLFRTCREAGPVLALAAAIFITGFAPQAAAQGFVGYVANSADNTVSLIAMDNNNDVVTGLNGSTPQTVTVGTAPVRVAVALNNRLVFVTNQSANSITVIDPTTNIALKTTITIPTVGNAPPNPQGIAVLENGTAITLYVANPGDNSVSIIDATNIKAGKFTQLARLTTGIGPTPIEVVLQQDGNAYVLNNNNGGVGTVSTINTGTNTVVKQAIQVAHNATGLAASPDGQVIYVTNRGDNSVTSIQVSNLVQTQITGVTDPVGVAFDPDPGAQNATRVAYVTNYSASSVTEILGDAVCTSSACDLATPLLLPNGAHPSQIQVVAAGGGSQVFVSDALAGDVLSFAPDNIQSPTAKTLLAGNVASGLAFFAFPDFTEPVTPVCGLTQALANASDQVEGICVGGGSNPTTGTNPGLIFQTDKGLFCGGGIQGAPCTGSGGFVGGSQDYSNVPAGVYTVIVCSDQNLTPPNCTGGVAAQQLLAWPGTGTPPTVTCPQFTATKDATLGLTADASLTCNDTTLSLPNNTNPHVNLTLIMKVDWGDGSFPFVQTQTQATGTQIVPPPHQYAKAGTYNVTLAAIDTTLLAATPQSISVSVTDAPPTCTFPTPSVNNFAVTAAPICLDEFGKPVTEIDIDWGQGVPGSPTSLKGGSVNQPTTFLYPTTTTQNTFTITVTTTAQGLPSKPVTQQVTVPSFTPQPPSCVISASATLFAAQAPVTCNATAPGDLIKSVLVTWGDGTSSPATPGTASFTETFQHTYPSVSAKYTITVVATDLAGVPSTAQQTTLTIVGPVAPVCSLNIQATGGFAVSATAQCQSEDTTLASVALDLGDGTVVQGTAGSPTFGPQTFNHTYAVAGKYNIILTATDSLELVTTLNGSVIVPTLTIVGPSEATISAGGTATFTLTVPAGLTVANPPLTLSCVPNPPATTLPPGFVCLFSPANPVPGGSSTLTIATNSVPPSTTSALPIPGLYGLGMALLPAMLLMSSTARRRKTGAFSLALICLVLVLVLVLGLAGCGTNPPPVSAPATSTSGTFTVQVQLADAKGNVLGTSTVTVTVK